MASLTHVCMWSDHGWKRITAEQAARLHPGGTVSARSGLFMCELCGQYVTLTDGDINVRYFKHSAYEKSKDCPERTFGSGYTPSYSSQEHDLPIRITSISSSSYRFELGLIRAPISSLSKDFRIEIKPKGVSDVSFVFAKQRLNSDKSQYDSVMRFANELTASDTETQFRYLTGEREVIDGQLKYDIPSELLLNADPGEFEDKDELKLSALLSFWRQLDGFDRTLNSLEAVCNWMYGNLVYYRPFHELIKYCRGNAVSLGELATGIFPDLDQENALKAVSVLLAIAPLAKNTKGFVLFPARMHMLFKGISGVYACANADCNCSHTEGGLTLGEIYLSDGNLICPHCGSVVYELYNDRRCGALFFKGYVLEDDAELHGNVYLWRYPGQLMDHRMKEVHLFIPTEDFELPVKQGKNAIKPCYLDVKSGFINFTDDSSAGKPWVRKLYYCNYSAKGRPQIITFPTCPHCRHQLSTSQLTSFSTRGNQSFFNLIKSQFQLQPAVPGKNEDPDRFPNEGRKVLLFSDSRQRAAKLLCMHGINVNSVQN